MRLKPEQVEEVLRELNFREGLVTAVVQDERTGEVLMVAHQDPEAVRKTLTTGLMHYWSRSRKKLWLKGESSGHIQRLKGVRVDCDGDSLLYRVEQVGGACHEGYRTCFFRGLKGGKLVEVGKRIFDPEKIYGEEKKRGKAVG
ncbi:MAG: phosphoribosyl-AMP cyclohydrolase [Hadesarchaea archaeon]|nr:MAG: phosphoribosyl-AMP cyclohydrolase [Hadesarchaea archaeon]